MKKLLLSIALLASLSVSAQISDSTFKNKSAEIFHNHNKSTDLVMRYDVGMMFSDSPKELKILKSDNSILERVSYRNEKYGTSVDQSKEIEFRKAKMAEYKKLGYAFDGMVTGSNGKFMKFVK